MLEKFGEGAASSALDHANELPSFATSRG